MLSDPDKATAARRRRPVAVDSPGEPHVKASQTLRGFVLDADRKYLAEQRRWALALNPEQMQGVETEVRMLRQALRDAFVLGDNTAVRQHAEELRRLLRERAVVPEIADRPDAGGGLEDGLSADLRRVLQRVGLEMGIDA